MNGLSTPLGEARRAIVYARLSKDMNGDGVNVADQVERGKALACARGWPVVAVEIDNDTSASSGRRRPGFEAVRSALHAGDAEVVIARDMDRLLRSGQDRVDMIKLGKSRGVLLAFWRDQELDLGTVGGRVTADLLGAIAQGEVDRKAERQRVAAERAAKAGHRLGGRRPFGYGVADPVTGRMDYDAVREDEAALIRQGYELLVNGVALAAIAREWNAHGVSPQGAGWRGSSVREVLLNPRYAGMRGHGSVPEHGRRKITSMYPAAWPALVPEATWQRAVVILRDPERRNAPVSATALLTGVALCARCDATVHGGRASRGHHKTYRCSGTPGHVARQQAPVDEYVSELVVRRMARPDAAGLVDRGAHESVHEALSRQAASLRERNAELAGLVADGTFSAADARAARARVADELAQVEARIAGLARTSVLAPLVAAQHGGEDAVRAAWDQLSTDRQRVVIGALMIVRLLPPGRGVRTFDPDSVEVAWRTE